MQHHLLLLVCFGLSPMLFGQSGVFYSEEESARRLARIQEIAASSNGKIEITIIRLPAEAAAATPSGTLADPAAASAPPAQEDAPHGPETIPLQPSAADWQNRFAHALSLQQKGFHRDALKVLLRLTMVQPRHPRSGECYYWMGESLFAINNPALAQRAFNKVLQYPQCEKYDDALLRVAMQYMQKGKSSKAQPYLQRLLANCPGSEYSGMARDLLNQFM